MVQLGEYPTEEELRTMVAEVDQVIDNSWHNLNSTNLLVVSEGIIYHSFVNSIYIFPGQEWDD